MKFKVATAAELEKAQYSVCCRLGQPQHFAGDSYGRCAHCGHGIFFRPYMPVKPAKICIECFSDLQKGGRA